MKSNEKRDSGYTNIANASAIAAIVFLGVVSIVKAITSGVRNISETELPPAIPMGFYTAGALAILLWAYRTTKNTSILAFVTPHVLLLYYTILMSAAGWSSPYYLLVCLCFLGISCIYSSFYITLWYAVLQIVVTGLLLLREVPVAGHDVSPGAASITWIFFLLGTLLLLLITKSATLSLGRAAADQNSFRTFLTTTANYVSMVDESNKVIHTTKPMAHLAQIENAELAIGRPLIDLFPGRELKLLVYKMLQQKEAYEDDWEFTLKRQKRYFKAFSTGLAGSSTGALISLHDMTHLAERDEIALMRDSLKIGLFFMDKNCIIQDQYSRFLEEVMSEKGLAGQCFLDVLSASFSTKELDAVRDYFDMVFTGSFDQSMLEDINPLNEWTYVCREETEKKKVFHCEIVTTERGHGEVVALVTIYDITAKTELQRRLLEEENRRQEEMRSIFELIQVEPGIFSDFLEDADYEFDLINEALKKETLSRHQVLVEVYQSIHAIKSNAVILGLNTFGNKVHVLESKIKKLREQDEEVLFNDILELVMDIENLFQEKDNFKVTINKIHSFRNVETTRDQGYVLIESLSKAAARSSEDTGKNVRFIAEDVDSGAIESGHRRIIKEVLMQFVRNSVVHGIEEPEERIARGKAETGTIRLSIKNDADGNVHIKLGDDGKGLDFDKIRKKAESSNLIGNADGNDKNALLKAIFLPGFSTAETEDMHAGRGIGLNLVLDRVREGRGSIKVHTEQGSGTVFNIFFPKEGKENMPENSEPVFADGPEYKF
ncbi:MAG: hypothetical protein LBH43_01165 [Treponema sp.]|jgi:two-component system chemotaxis sensor kinase CheA|nr:hypothetical protein [Treponema sp.]